MSLDDHAPLRGPTGRLTRARAILRDAERVLVLTGAGISAESGVPTFRDAMHGYWRQFRPEDLATPEAFARNPIQVWAWYDSRRAQLRECGPNRAHDALARWILAASWMPRAAAHRKPVATRSPTGPNRESLAV